MRVLLRQKLQVASHGEKLKYVHNLTVFRYRSPIHLPLWLIFPLELNLKNQSVFKGRELESGFISCGLG